MSGWQHAVYPLGLLVALSCLAVIDRRYRLALWQAPRRAVAVLLIAVAFFTTWDIAGIHGGIFFAARDTYRSGLMLGPSFPVEELLFLLLLNYTALLSWAYFGRRR